MNGRPDRNRFQGRVNPKTAHGIVNGREPLAENGGDRTAVQVDVADAASAHLVKDGPGDHVARRQVGRRMVMGHESFLAVVDQVGALPSHRFRDQETGRAGDVKNGGVKLNEFKVRQDRPGPVGGRHPVAGGNRRIGGLLVKLADAAGRQDGGGGPNNQQGAFLPFIKKSSDHVVAGGKQVDQKVAFPNLDLPGLEHPGGKGTDQFRPAAVSGGVNYPRGRVAALPGEGQLPSLAVKGSAEFQEFGDAFRPLLHQEPGRRLRNQAGAGSNRILEVVFKGVA
ncbi:MAG: hypothetical protein BWY73_01643 [candidate division TA06 bacterium ADurb.Bin417]|uniref:Uncharacterized protein n=1 Tax=candidate division TA06 bacterium ADurb.Bin417 TaxID=1852828 RepID=A0A1V5M5T5_UNCT6|nr:MAG: hypothetical protein BWY73_01643 [candidate division TA06 bacterium ADurb.Bin417]